MIDVTPSRRARPSAGHDAALMGDRAATRGRSAMERGDDHASIRTPISRTGSSPSVPQQHARTERCDQRRAPKSATADRRSRSRSFSANRSSRRSTGSRCRCRAGPGAARSGVAPAKRSLTKNPARPRILPRPGSAHTGLLQIETRQRPLIPHVESSIGESRVGSYSRRHQLST